MEFEAKIISKHNLDCRSLENLAKDISNRLDCNIEYGNYQVNNGNREFIQFGDIIVNTNEVKATLYDMTNDNYSDFNYVLELGEEAKLIFNHLIQLLPPWEVDFDEVFNKYNADVFEEDSYYKSVFEELKTLGADKICFIKDTFKPELTVTAKSTAEKYWESLRTKATFFEIEL